MDTATTKFDANIYKIKHTALLLLPEKESQKLPSRGQVAVFAKINGHEFRTVLEPDGMWGHFIKISDELQKDAGVSVGDTVSLELTPTRDWPEPVVPDDFAKSLSKASRRVQDKWRDITPMARWEWVRWINSTANPDTRKIRIEKTISKLNGKHRRPCCFNLAACTDPELAKNGRLIETVR